MRRRREAAAIWFSHGVGDAASTALCDLMIGAHAEPNPIVRGMLREHGPLAAAASIVAVVSIVAVAYPTAARIGRFPSWFGSLLVLIGVVVTLGNLVSVIGVVG